MFRKYLYSNVFVVFLLVFNVVYSDPIDISKIMSAKDLNASMVGKEVVIRGPILAEKASSGETDPLLMHVANNEEDVAVLIGYLPEKFSHFHGELGVPEVGTVIIARGKVWEYEGKLLITPQKLEDIIIQNYPHTMAQLEQERPVQVSNASNPEVDSEDKKASALTIQDYPTFKSLLGKDVTFTGKVGKFTESWSEKAPNILTFMHGEDKLEVVFWDRENPISPELKKVGVEVIATGELQDYRGRLQLKVSDTSTLKLVSPKS